MRPLVQEPMKTVSTFTSRIGVPASQAHVGQRPLGGVALGGFGEVVGGGHRGVQGDDLGRVRAPGDVRRQGGGVDDHLLVEGGVVVGDQRAPVGDGLVPGGARSARTGRPFEVGERRLVGGDQAGPGPGLDRHVADGHPAFHRQGPDGRAPVLDDGADPAAGADAADDGQDDVLGRDPGGQVAVDGDRHGPGSPLGEGLGGQDVLDLAGADAEGRARRRPRGSRCASRRRRWSCPGWVRPCSGPMMWTMPWSGSPIEWRRMPNSAVLARRVSTWVREIGSSMGPSVVGTLWSSVATVRSGRRTGRPAMRRPSKAWGEVTSWTRCRSM